ncbi:unnamed protein product [Phytophthora fragariaefolia]|uniref:Unnamed protein product n=1 Tax=Phytophthora fragariaefolia TaxID=1490495 RepID=A0A9W6TTU1_9STRA|nr:unnamed protein product [Phytophthora fragariaefolia]
MRAFNISHHAFWAPGAVKAGYNRGFARSGSLREARTRGCGPWIGAGIADTGSNTVDRVPGIVDNVAVTTVRVRGVTAGRDGMRRRNGAVWVLAARRRADADVTAADEAAATTAADSTGSGVVAIHATEAAVVAGALGGVVKPNTNASGASLPSAAAMDLSSAVVDAARLGRPSHRG